MVVVVLLLLVVVVVAVVSVVVLLVVVVFCDGTACANRFGWFQFSLVLVPFLSFCSSPSRRRNARPRWPSLVL
jgi:hypothetical protein